MAIYTRDIAADILETFENILIENNISVPSPEDNERDPDDKYGLYGSVYYNLLDTAESILIDTLKKYKDEDEVITGKFNK